MFTSAKQKFTVSEETWDGINTWVLRGPKTSARVASLGATLLEWQQTWGGLQGADLVAGYPNAGALERGFGVRNAIMFPWANRVADSKYTWAGQEQVLATQKTFEPVAMHGWLRNQDLTLLKVASGVDFCAVSFGFTSTPDLVTGYPFALEIEVTWTLRALEIFLEIKAKNVGGQPAPVVFGWHPYLKVPGHENIDDLLLHIPAQVEVVTDKDLIPLAGPAGYRRLEGPVAHEHLRGHSYDGAWTDLVASSDGWVRTVLGDHKTGDAIAVKQRTGVVTVFTADGFKPPRPVIAIEPSSGRTNAFNNADEHEQITLQPGQQASFGCGLEIMRDVV